jgi:SAM-dependent methyltransferase
MSQLFGSVYADSYDTLYQDKDYSAECDLIEKQFQEYCTSGVRSVLDLGCGTGNHAVPLAERGYKVTGVDRSPEMIAQAHQKASLPASSGNLTLHCTDIRDLNLSQKFDAVLLMFAVLGYQLSNQDVVSTLSTARRHLEPGGLLVLDVWYGPAVLFNRPSQRVKVVNSDHGQVLRVSSGTLDTRRHLCHVDYLLWILEGNRLVRNAEESHSMRYFFPLELEFFLQSTGFSPVRLGPFPEFKNDPDETTWNVVQVAKAI